MENRIKPIHQPEDQIYNDLLASIPAADEHLATNSDSHLENDESMQPQLEQSSWMQRNLLKVSAAAFIGGTAVTLATNPTEKVKDEVVAAAPWVVGGIAASESLWIGGAAMMAGSAGRRIGNPLKLKGRYDEITQSIVLSPAFKTGLAVNTAGAIGTAGVVAAGAFTSLPAETWPGAVGIAAADMVGTVALRSGLYKAIKNGEAEKPESSLAEKEPKPKVKVRHALITDIDRLADIDLLLFDKAYGTEKPEKAEIVEMLEERYKNAPDWMFVAEVNGEVEGFVTAFPTDKPIEEFKSWEDCTANGTLDGCVDPNGKYVYVANMTIKHEAVELGAEDMLLANLFANAIQHGAEYGYFVSRMPHFKRWMESQDIEPTKQNAQELADTYLNLRRDEDGKRHDPQLRMYEDYGFKLKRMVGDAFEDDASMNYGVVFKAAIPPSENLKKIKPVRILVSKALRQIAKNPKLLGKVI